MEKKENITRIELDTTGRVRMMNSLALTTPSWIDVPKKSSMNFNRVKMCVGEMLNNVLEQYISLRRESLLKTNDLKSGQPFMPGFNFFDDVDDSRYFTRKVYLKDTGVGKNNYDDFKKLVKNLFKIGVEVPIRGLDGVTYIQVRSLFVGAVPEEKHVKYVLISIDKEAVNKSLNFFLGYSDVYSQIIKRFAPTAHVQSTYFFLKGHSKDFTCKVRNYKKFLGIAPDAYSSSSQFKAHVLEKTCRLMKEMFDVGRSDIWFEYVLDTDNIKFKRHDSKILSKVNSVEDISSMEKKNKSFCNSLIGLGVENNVSVKLAKRITDYNYFDACSKIREIRNKISANDIENIGGYVFSSLDKFFNEEQEKEKNVMSKSPCERFVIMIAFLCKVISKEDVSAFSTYRFNSYKDNVLIIDVPDFEIATKMEQKYLSLLKKCVTKYFGSLTKVNYHRVITTK